MKAIIFASTFFCIVRALYLDRECTENEAVLDCTMLSGKGHLEVSMLKKEVTRITFLRWTGTLSLHNLPNLQHIDVQYNNPDCDQLVDYHGRVVISGEEGPIICQIDSTTPQSPEPTDYELTTLEQEQKSPPSPYRTTITDEKTFTPSPSSMMDEQTSAPSSYTTTTIHVDDQTSTEDFSRTGVYQFSTKLHVKTDETSNSIIMIISIISVLAVLVLIVGILFIFCRYRRRKLISPPVSSNMLYELYEPENVIYDRSIQTLNGKEIYL